MDAATTLDQPYQPLLDWLAAEDIEYEIHQHDPTFTARATAIAEGVDPRTFAKVVGVATREGRNALVVLDATDHLDRRKAHELLDTSDVRLLSEPELRALAPGCELGAIPAVGALFGLATYADYAVRDDPEISFNAGSHRFSARVERGRWEKACNVVYADLAEDADAGPRLGTLMTTAHDVDRIEGDQVRSSSLVWIDAREAVIVRVQGDRARIERVESEVPAHRRATGHVRHEPAVRHGGGGSPQTAGEAHRLEHLRQFVADVANRLPAGDPLLILGPGTVHERLAQHLSESDARHGRDRDIVCEASMPLTDRQLVTRGRRFAGVEPRRRTVGAYRWSEPQTHDRSGRTELPPRRVADKPAHAR